MEFASGFVYVPPPPSQKDSQRSSANIIKRSALLPPVNRIRPSNPPPPPPPPPTNSAKSPKAIPSSPKIMEQLEKSRDVKKVAKSTRFYENAEYHNKLGAACSVNATPQKTTSSRKTALLPPHMRPAGNSQSPSHNQALTHNTISQMFTYDLPKDEVDLNAKAYDPNYSYNTPEGNGGQVTLPADIGTLPTTAPALPPRPSFMRSLPEYLVLIPSSASSPSSSQKSSSTPPLAQSPTGSDDKGPLSGNPNVVLISLGKLLSEERVQHIQGEPTYCSQCGSVLDTCYDNVVNECYFCQSSDSSSSPSTSQSSLNGYQEGLFFLNPNEKPMCGGDALLLFCIDISGSMSITSQVMDGEHIVHKSRLQFVQEAVLQSVQRLSEQQSDTRVGIITFNHQVTMHGNEEVSSQCLSGAELMDSNYLKEAAASFPSPLPLSQTKNYLHRQVMGQQAKQVIPDVPLLGSVFQLLLEDPKAFPGWIKYVISSESSGSTLPSVGLG